MKDNEQVPQQCRLCMHYTKYLTLGVERHLCELGKPMHDKCQWFEIRRIGHATT